MAFIELRLTKEQFKNFSECYEKETKENPKDDIGIYISMLDNDLSNEYPLIGYPFGTYLSHFGNTRDWK